MGNRAHVIFRNSNEVAPPVYLHWNGGPESMEAFMWEMARRGVSGKDVSSAYIQFILIVNELLAQGYGSDYKYTDTSKLTDQDRAGLLTDDIQMLTEKLQEYDYGDNGVYVVEPELKVRRFARLTPDGEFRELTPEEIAADRNAERCTAYLEAVQARFIGTALSPETLRRHASTENYLPLETVLASLASGNSRIKAAAEVYIEAVPNHPMAPHFQMAVTLLPTLPPGTTPEDLTEAVAIILDPPLAADVKRDTMHRHDRSTP